MVVVVVVMVVLVEEEEDEEEEEEEEEEEGVRAGERGRVIEVGKIGNKRERENHIARQCK